MPPSSSLKVINAIVTLRQFVCEQRRNDANLCVALVPTMGALHQGHLQLVHQARAHHQHENDGFDQHTQSLVIVSIFVNPLQFGPNEDYERYPRTLNADLAKLDGIADCAFVPDIEKMFGAKHSNAGMESVGVKAGRIGPVLEGASRPLYHDGMLTHVAKLFNIVQPDVAFFGKKDAQQLFAIQQMVSSLNFPVRIVPVDTLREQDGLALSSRNRYLSNTERQHSLYLFNMLAEARNVAKSGAKLATVMAQANKMLDEAELRDILRKDYLAVVDPNTFESLESVNMEQFNGTALILVAAFVGGTRLIDNIEVDING
uniref:Pantoate--beta-alanine ligase n=1 Tax=Globodera rostochiensis TaxID=31243 RepID=A0A914HM52_GLORO